MRLLQRLAQAVTLLAAAWIALWACAPPSSLPPPLPLASEPVDFGAAVVPGVTLVPQWEEQPDGSLVLGRHPEPALDAQAWVVAGGEEIPCQGGLVAYGGTTTAAGGGLFTRCDVARNESLYLGPQLEGGWLWAGAGMPVGWMANPRLLIYSTPTFRVGSAQPFLLPLGVALRTEKRAVLTAEAGLRWDPLEALGYQDTNVWYLAVGATR